jgi:hypothetical protein
MTGQPLQKYAHPTVGVVSKYGMMISAAEEEVSAAVEFLMAEATKNFGNF